MKIKKFVFTVQVAGLLTGCVHYQPQPLSPKETADRLESRRLDDLELKKFLEQNDGHDFANWPKKSWDLQDLTLVAFNFHPSLEVARAQWLVASAGLRTAGARLNPSVSVAPGYDSQIPGNFSPWIVPVTFDLPIETAGKRAKRIAEAEKNSEAARWNFASAAWQIRVHVRSSLLDLKIAERRAGLLQKEFSAQKRISELLQQRLAAGLITRPDVTIAEIALNKTQLDLSDAKSRQAEAHARLAESLGLSEAALDGEEFTFDFSKTDFQALTSIDARRIALQTRPDILAALADYAATEAELRLQIAKQYPDLHLGPGYIWNNGNAGDSQWTLGATLELPILDQNQGPIAEAEARRHLAAAKFVELQSQIIGDIDRAVAEFRVAGEQLENGKELLLNEQKQQKSAEAQLAAGSGDQLDLVNAQLELSNASLTQLDNEAKLQAALGALEDALQRPADSLSTVIEKMSAMVPQPFHK
ncbi:MAG TPA: TolC family protein [Verrucomicrobiae bacterium]|jgi:outer membrane protein TolC